MKTEIQKLEKKINCLSKIIESIKNPENHFYIMFPKSSSSEEFVFINTRKMELENQLLTLKTA